MKQLLWVEMTDETRVAVFALLNATVMPVHGKSEIKGLACFSRGKFEFAAKSLGACSAL
jgi:hypothetical protein